MLFWPISCFEMCRRWIALTHSALFLGQSYPNFTDRMYVFHDAKLQIAFSSRLLMLFLRCCNYGRGTAQSVLNRMQNAPLNYKYSAWKVLSHFLRACWRIGLCWEMASKACLVVCVCVSFCLKMGIFYFRKIPERSARVSRNKPLLIVDLWDDESSATLWCRWDHI